MSDVSCVPRLCVTSLIRIDVLYRTTLLLTFVWQSSYKIPYVNAFIFKISHCFPNNRRNTQILIVISVRLHSRSMRIILEQIKHTKIRNTARFCVDSLFCVNPFPEKNVFARQ